MGTPTFSYSSDLYNAKAQKWGGVHKNISRNMNQGMYPPMLTIESTKFPTVSNSKSSSPSAAAHQITGGVEPAMPPITIF